MTELSDYKTKSLQKLGEAIFQGKWNNEGLVQLIELAADYKATIILGHKYIINNE